ncbi:MAG: hypothetical protein U0S48_15685 [Solirubrobacteraceae bacterium]
MPPEYTFLPWLRRGLAAEITRDDDLGTAPEAAPAGRPSLPVALSLDTEPVDGGTPAAQQPAVSRTVSLLGPGDVGALKGEAVMRVHPPPGALGVTPGELAYVEFYDEDLPWRYTPARPVASRLRPWLALLVLTAAEVERSAPARGAALGVVTPVAGAPMPDITETWAWAHAQLPQAVAAAGDVGAAIAADPDSARSRLLCPRRLEPETAYRAFLVPAFDAGRLAGLGRSPAAAPQLRPAWGTPAHANDRDLPVYHEWGFTTGTAGDFETLARRLVPRAAGPEFGQRRLDVSDPGFGMTPRPGAETGLEGALAPPSFAPAPFPAAPGPAVAAQLRDIVDAGEHARDGSPPADPLVVPPAYGRRHAGVPLVADAESTADLAWLAELNEDPRARAAAGLGAEIVRERQEEYVQRAWEQVGEVEAANQRLREAELARAAADALLRKHVAQAGDADRVLLVTATALSGLATPAAEATSVRGAVDASRVPAAALDPAFRRVTRPQRPVMRRLTGASDVGAIRDGLLDAMNADEPLTAAPPAPEPAAGVALDAVTGAIAASAARLASEEDDPARVFVDLLATELAARRAATPPQDLDALAPATLRAALDVRVTDRFPAGAPPADAAVAVRVRALVDAITAVASDGVADAALVTLRQDAFAAEFGDAIAGKARAGLTVAGDAPPADVPIGRMTDSDDVAAFAADLAGFRSTVEEARPDPPPADPLAPPASLADHVLGALAPARAVGERIAAALPVIAARPATDPARLAPVMAHPRFRDPLFEPLRALSQDYVIPNLAGLPADSLTLMEPNARFIEAVLAGANHAFMQELLWREYPTDQRGTSFQVFWDTRDALDDPSREDIPPMPSWSGALGAQSATAAGVLVLVVRGELLVRFPGTVLLAQRAAFAGGDPSAPRVLDPAGEVRHPILHARLDPDVTLAGFALTEDQARGHRPAGTGDPKPADPGWFFVLMERPGEARFGLDDATPPEGLRTWDDLAWDALAAPGGTPNVAVTANAALAPSALPAGSPVWGRTAADMAAILLQRPVLLARHAAEMLP